MANRPFVLVVGAALMMLMLAASSGSAQTRDHDFGPDGKPAQVGGPGFGQTAPAPATPTPPAPQPPSAQPPVQGQPGQPGAQPPAVQPPASGQPPIIPPVTPPPPVPPVSAARRVVGAVRSALPYVFGVLFLIGIVVVAVVVLRSRRAATPTPTRRTSGGPPIPTTGARPVISPATPRPGASPATPAPAPATPAPAPTPGTGSGTPTATPVIALFALLFGVQAISRADSKTANINSMYPSAVAAGNSVLSTLKGGGLDGLVGCAVALPDVGCSLDHLSSSSEAVVRVTAGGGAMGTGKEPLRGTLRLRFSDGTTRDFANAFAVGTTDQIGTAMLARHVTPPTPPAPPPQVINRTVYRTDPAVAKRLAELERWRASQSAAPTPASAPAPVPQPTPVAPVAPTPAPTPAANNELAGIRQQLGQMQSSLESQGGRIDGLADQVRDVRAGFTAINQNNEKLVKGMEVIGGYTVKALRKKGDRCDMIAEMRKAGFTVSNPPAGCK